MNQTFLEHVKGHTAMAVGYAGVLVAWLPDVESCLRIITSLIGIIALLYTIRYWRRRGDLLDWSDKEDEE